ncbi:MAG TPA: zf-TFIIB domain-containing protein [Polyangiaceae bacterium]
MEIEAGLYRCPNCGGDVAEGARSCPYCKAELSTLRCHECFSMNSSRAVHCAACGRALGLEPVGDDDERVCPKCKHPLVRFEGYGGVLFDCAGCGGQFVEHGLLASLLEAREITGLALPRRVRKSKLEVAAVRYLPCPSCKALMNRKNFGGESGVVVDVCSAHGTWFDEGELPAVLAFVESGGLVVAEHHTREKRRTNDGARAAGGAFLADASRITDAPSDFEEMKKATVELFEWLVSEWKKR